MVVKLSERDVTKQVISFLEAHGWRVTRLHSGLFQRPGSLARISVGTKGQPDWLALKAPRMPTKICPWTWTLWIEFKAKGKRLSPHQAEWHLKAEKDGFTVVVVDDFTFFESWYRASGFEL